MKTLERHRSIKEQYGRVMIMVIKITIMRLVPIVVLGENTKGKKLRR